MQDTIHIEDKSGDKGCFTIIPNLILDNSTGEEQALYLQMKRLAGDKGKCFATIKTLEKKLRWKDSKISETIKKLLDKKWITKSGTVPGKTHPINAYQITNIWDLNNKSYPKKKDPSNRYYSEKEKKKDPSNRYYKDPSNRSILILKEKKNLSIAKQSSAGQEINHLIGLFRDINPSYEKFFSNKTQRGCIERLIKKFGVEKIEKIIATIEKTNGEKFAPVITTPIQLENKLGDFLVFIKKENKNKPTII